MIYTRRIDRCIEEKSIRRFRNKSSEICVSRGIFVRIKKEFEGGDS